VRRHSPAVVEMRDHPTFGLSGEPRRRALLIAEAIVREARRRKWSVTVVDGRRSPSRGMTGHRSAQMTLSVGPDGAGVWFAQPRSRSETPAVRRGAPVYAGQFAPSDRLVLRARADASYTIKEWRDTKSRSLEESIGAVIGWVEREIGEQVGKRERWEAEAPAREAARLSEIERMMAQIAAQRHEADLTAQAGRWRQARDLREYLDAVRTRRLAYETDPAKVAEMEAWLAVSEQVVDRLDPLGPLAPPR
jgi:hypothetical protein